MTAVAHPGDAADPGANTSPLTPNPRYAVLATEEMVRRTVGALEAHGMHAIVVDDPPAARKAVLALLPEHAEVFDAASQTVAALGIDKDLADASRFSWLRPSLQRLRQEGKPAEQRKLGSIPDYIIGSVHAVTEDGDVVIASATGSQLAPYAYGAGHVIWVVGTQKIVPNLEAALRRVREYSFPLEDARARRVYGQGSSVSKVLVVSREFEPGRITVVFVRENLGF